MMKGKDQQPRLLCPTKLSFRIEGQIKSFPDKKKLRNSSSTNQYYMNVKESFLRRTKIKNDNRLRTKMAA